MHDFKTCLDSSKYATFVQEDMEAGAAVGVSGTPGFFVNGRFVSGAQPFSTFKGLIDEEPRIGAGGVRIAHDQSIVRTRMSLKSTHIGAPAGTGAAGSRGLGSFDRHSRRIRPGDTVSLPGGGEA